jgi:hypothetical protein
LHSSSCCFSAADFFISFSTAFFLIQSKKNILPQTVGLINSLVRLTFQTAAPASLWCVKAQCLPLKTLIEFLSTTQRAVERRIAGHEEAHHVDHIQHAAPEAVRHLHDVDAQCAPRARATEPRRRNAHGFEYQRDLGRPLAAAASQTQRTSFPC